MATLAKLEQEGWSLNPQALKDMQDEFECTETELLETICDIDLKRIVAKGALPEDVNRMVSGALKGPMVLQVGLDGPHGQRDGACKPWGMHRRCNCTCSGSALPALTNLWVCLPGNLHPRHHPLLHLIVQQRAAHADAVLD